MTQGTAHIHTCKPQLKSVAAKSDGTTETIFECPDCKTKYVAEQKHENTFTHGPIAPRPTLPRS